MALVIISFTLALLSPKAYAFCLLRELRRNNRMCWRAHLFPRRDRYQQLCDLESKHGAQTPQSIDTCWAQCVHTIPNTYTLFFWHILVSAAQTWWMDKGLQCYFHTWPGCLQGWVALQERFAYILYHEWDKFFDQTSLCIRKLPARSVPVTMRFACNVSSKMHQLGWNMGASSQTHGSSYPPTRMVVIQDDVCGW